MLPPQGSVLNILAYDHVGIRVTDRARSMAFYESLGFRLDEAHSSSTALEIVNAHGVRLNLIVNGVSTPDHDNVLLDRASKWPGYTHAAFTVEKLSDILDWAKTKKATITEGPVDWGRRLTCFLRDPDSNVLEFNELTNEQSPLSDAFTLVIGQKNYSSWSMRAWLLLRSLNIPFEEITVPLYRPESREAVRTLGGQAGLVPVLLDRGTPIWDTLAIFEYVYERYPGVWPRDKLDRARARSISGEIHSSFNALRAAMPVNTRARNRHANYSSEVQADIDRVVQISETYKGGSPWLFGGFSGVDIMLAPIATRFQTYGVALSGSADSYFCRLLGHPLVVEWLRLGSLETDNIPLLDVGQ